MMVLKQMTGSHKMPTQSTLSADVQQTHPLRNTGWRDVECMCFADVPFHVYQWGLNVKADDALIKGAQCNDATKQAVTIEGMRVSRATHLVYV